MSISDLGQFKPSIFFFFCNIVGLDFLKWNINQTPSIQLILIILLLDDRGERITDNLNNPNYLTRVIRVKLDWIQNFGLFLSWVGVENIASTQPNPNYIYICVCVYIFIFYLLLISKSKFRSRNLTSLTYFTSRLISLLSQLLISHLSFRVFIVSNCLIFFFKLDKPIEHIKKYELDWKCKIYSSRICLDVYWKGKGN